jgi:hypothetical protein
MNPDIDKDVSAVLESIRATVKGYCASELAKAVAAIPAAKDGKDGSEGLPGKDGAPGEPGHDGKDGAPGEPGKDGAPGEPGKDGAPGLPGKDGSNGKDGLNGADGMNGKDGAPGERGAPGEKGADGLEGPPGRDGQDGRDGREGKDGAPGRDAAHIEVLGGIDETRSYARGTYASHQGGLIRAVRTTDPVSEGIEKAGWQVVIEGLAALSITQSETDPRTFAVAAIQTSGKSHVQSFTFPAMIYRGIWTEGEFKHGDTVTWDGSLWHCEKSTTAHPGTTTDWKLVAKRGRDGKDGKPGEKGERGSEGKMGRDSHLSLRG